MGEQTLEALVRACFPGLYLIMAQEAVWGAILPNVRMHMRDSITAVAAGVIGRLPEVSVQASFNTAGPNASGMDDTVCFLTLCIARLHHTAANELGALQSLNKREAEFAGQKLHQLQWLLNQGQGLGFPPLQQQQQLGLGGSSGIIAGAPGISSAVAGAVTSGFAVGQQQQQLGLGGSSKIIAGAPGISSAVAGAVTSGFAVGQQQQLGLGGSSGIIAGAPGISNAVAGAVTSGFAVGSSMQSSSGPAGALMGADMVGSIRGFGGSVPGAFGAGSGFCMGGNGRGTGMGGLGSGGIAIGGMGTGRGSNPIFGGQVGSGSAAMGRLSGFGSVGGGSGMNSVRARDGSGLGPLVVQGTGVAGQAQQQQQGVFGAASAVNPAAGFGGFQVQLGQVAGASTTQQQMGQGRHLGIQGGAGSSGAAALSPDLEQLLQMFAGLGTAALHVPLEQQQQHVPAPVQVAAPFTAAAPGVMLKSLSWQIVAVMNSMQELPRDWLDQAGEEFKKQLKAVKKASSLRGGLAAAAAAAGATGQGLSLGSSGVGVGSSGVSGVSAGFMGGPPDGAGASRAAVLDGVIGALGQIIAASPRTPQELEKAAAWLVQEQPVKAALHCGMFSTFPQYLLDELGWRDEFYVAIERRKKPKSGIVFLVLKDKTVDIGVGTCLIEMAQFVVVWHKDHFLNLTCTDMLS